MKVQNTYVLVLFMPVLDVYDARAYLQFVFFIIPDCSCERPHAVLATNAKNL